MGETRSRSAGRPGPQQMVQNPFAVQTRPNPLRAGDVPRSEAQQADAAPHLQLITPETRCDPRRTVVPRRCKSLKCAVKQIGLVKA